MYKIFLYYFGDLDDKRKFGKIKYDLFEVLFISFIFTLCGEDSFNGMSHFGSLQEDWFRKYLKLENELPSHDTFRTVLNMLDQNDFSPFFKGVRYCYLREGSDYNFAISIFSYG